MAQTLVKFLTHVKKLQINEARDCLPLPTVEQAQRLVNNPATPSLDAMILAQTYGITSPPSVAYEQALRARWPSNAYVLHVAGVARSVGDWHFRGGPRPNSEYLCGKCGATVFRDICTERCT